MTKKKLSRMELTLKKMSVLAMSVFAAKNNFGASGNNHAAGLVPDPGATQGNTKFLREDGTWAVPHENSTASVVAITADTSSSCSITGAGNSGKTETIVYTNSSGADLLVTVPTTYSTPDGAAIELTCPDGGYCEVNYLNISGTIYARGL